MSEREILIPLHYATGFYGLNDILGENEDCLELCLDKYGILTCEVPLTKGTVRKYSVPDNLADTMKIVYDDAGALQKITYDNNGQTEYLYINTSNPVYKEKVIDQYITRNIDIISGKILSVEGTVIRIMFDKFYDGEAANFYATVGLESDRQAILDEYDNNIVALDNSGEYPRSRWFFAENDLLSVFLMCCNPKESSSGFNNICSRLVDGIVAHVDSAIVKADDYKVVVNQYD